MSIKVASNRFMHSSLKGFYRCLTYTGFQALGEKFIYEAETAQAFRQTEKLEELGLILSNFPLGEYRPIGQYYLAWCSSRKGLDVLNTFEQIIEVSSRYRARALIDLGSSMAGKGNFDSALKYYEQAIKYAGDYRALTQAVRSIAAVKGIEGFHNHALKDFERIAPIIKCGEPIEKYQYLNSLAVELIEVGRIKEASNISNIVLASPFAFAYPEWRETADDLELREYRSSRSAVYFALKSTRQNVLPLPLSDSSITYARNPFQPPATVRSIDEWKKMPKKKNGDKKDDDYALPPNPTERDIFFRIMHIASQEGLSEEKLWEMLDAVERIAEESEE